MNATGKLCIEVTKKSKVAYVSEDMCIGCGLCARRCPFGAIQVHRLPAGVEVPLCYRYEGNGFRLYGLPLPQTKQVIGIIGANGLGKSTAFKVLAGRVPLAETANAEAREFRSKNLRVAVKPQHVDLLLRHAPSSCTVSKFLLARDERGVAKQLIEALQLECIMNRDMDCISGGEVQRLAIAAVAVQSADVYIFDEPSSYLDVRQRLVAGRLIRDLCPAAVMCADHDLCLMEFMSDLLYCMQGVSGAYGIVSSPMPVASGIASLCADIEIAKGDAPVDPAEPCEPAERMSNSQYPQMTKTWTWASGEFRLTVAAGDWRTNQITAVVGQNGSGKTTFLRLLARTLTPDAGADGAVAEWSEYVVSHKPQRLTPTFQGTVRALLMAKVHAAMADAAFQRDVLKPLHVDALYDQELCSCGGGELQRIGLVLALGKPADVYLLDEISSFLDAAQRVAAAYVIKRFTHTNHKAVFIVEHDLQLATFLADRMIVISGVPGERGVASPPQPMHGAMNAFLKDLEVTGCYSSGSGRTRLNTVRKKGAR